MADLLAVQADFAAALRDAGATPAAARWIAGDAALAERRLGIYRANVAASITKALSAAYPVVRQVVGDEFFDALARACLAGHPSTSGDLNDYGAGFADFVERFPHTQSLPYLADLARVEWAVQRAHGAADVAPFDPAALAGIAPEQQESLRFRWADGVALVDSPHPVARLWEIHQPGFDGEFAADWSLAQCALVARDGWRVVVSALAAGDAAFMRAALAGAPLGAAIDAALAVEPAFDAGALLGRAVASHLISTIVPFEDS